MFGNNDGVFFQADFKIINPVGPLIDPIISEKSKKKFFFSCHE